jgi:hypothetical protein
MNGAAVAGVSPRSPGVDRRTAVRLVILIGVVSLLSDMTYEGARSIHGSYLAVLGATGLVVGVVAGAGEPIGYALNLLAVPALAPKLARACAAARGHRHGAVESIMRTALAEMTPIARCGTGFGLLTRCWAPPGSPAAR